MHNRDDRDLRQLYPIDEPIAVNEYLSERIALDLRDNPSAIRQLCQGLRSFDASQHYRLGVPLRVAGDVRGDLFDVFQRFGRPD